MEWTDRAKLLVGKTASGTVLPSTFRLLEGSVWQSRQSELASFGTALVSAEAAEVASANASSNANGNGIEKTGRRVEIILGKNPIPARDRLSNGCPLFGIFWLVAHPATGLPENKSSPTSRCALAAISKSSSSRGNKAQTSRNMEPPHVGCYRQLRSARMTIRAGKIIIPAGILELVAGRGKLEQFIAAALRQNDVAGVAVVGA